MFAASWCCSVGMSWTVELRPVGLTPADGTAQPGPAAEWICSGIPTQLPAPDRQTAHLLGERGLLLFPREPVEAVDPTPRARSRRLIGYVTRDHEVMALALMLADALVATPAASPVGCPVGTDSGPDHPMVLAARWIQAGYSVDATARWIAAGITCPESWSAESLSPLNP